MVRGRPEVYRGMSRVIWHTMMSLDGYIAGPDDSMDWAREQPGGSALADETRDRIGAIVAGRRWYDLATERWDGRHGIYGGKWDGPVLVLTHRPPETWDDAGISFVSGGIEDAVAKARERAGDKAVGLFGANIARQGIEAGLVDEIVVHVAPVLLGGGVRFYGGDGAPHVRLERDGDEQVADLRLRVRSR